MWAHTEETYVFTCLCMNIAKKKVMVAMTVDIYNLHVAHWAQTSKQSRTWLDRDPRAFGHRQVQHDPRRVAI